MKKIMVFGTFDVLHKGHLNFLEQARERGDFLIAVIGRDLSVKNIKGKFPIENEELRRKNIAKYVDKAVLGDLNDFYKVIRENKPDTICLGYDQNEFQLKEKIKDIGIIEIIRLDAYLPNKFKSSLINKGIPKNK